MRIFIYLICLLLFATLIMGCKGSENLNVVTNNQSNVNNIESMTIKFKNQKKYDEIHKNKNAFEVTLEERMKAYEKVDISRSDWQAIISIINMARYDEKQYDEVKNPSGRMLKIREQDYTIVISYLNGEKIQMQIWKNSAHIIINGKWYFIDEKALELKNIIEKYTNQD